MSIKLNIEPVRSLAFGSIGVAYMGIGSSFDYPVRKILIQNRTNAPLMFSDDGLEDKLPLASFFSISLDISNNKTISDGLSCAKGVRFYVKQLTGAPTMGDVSITAIYGDKE